MWKALRAHLTPDLEKPVPRRTTVALAAILATASIGLAACGGDDGDSSSDATADITKSLKTILTSTDANAVCDLASANFMKTVFTDRATCIKASTPEPDDSPKPTDAKVSDVEVDGDKATVTLTEVGGDSDGASGTVQMIKEDGTWKVDSLGVDYLRSQLKTSLENPSGEAQKEVEQFANAETRQCFLGKMDALSDDDFRQLAYDSIADKPEPNQQFTQAFTECLASAPADSSSSSDDSSSSSSSSSGDDTSITFLRQKFEEGIEEAAKKDGASQETIDCVKTQLRDSISDDQITELVTTGGKATPELTQKVAQALGSC